MNALDVILFFTIIIAVGIISFPMCYQVGYWVEDQWKEMFEDIKRKRAVKDICSEMKRKNNE